MKGVVLVGFTGACETGDESYYIEGTGDSAIFTIISAAVGPPAAGGGTPAYRPEVTILSPKGQAVFSSEATVLYQATDKNDTGSGDQPFGLSLTPVSIFYSDQILEWDHTIVDDADKILIAKNLPASGSYTWNIKNLTLGNFYRIIVDAIDKIGEIGNDVSDFFSIDLTPPTFIVRADPPVTKLGKVILRVDSGEDLKEPPTLVVTQHGGKGVSVPMEGSGTNFEGVYEVLPGYDGTASIKISGLDRAGNLGTTILSGGSFNVGVHPPPPPDITTPQNNAVVAGDEIRVTGTSREDTDIVLIVNGVDRYGTKPGADGVFVIDKITLNKTLPRGESVLSIAARDQAATMGEAVVLRVSVNAKPVVLLEKPGEDSILSGTSTLLVATIADENNDQVALRYEARPLFPAGADKDMANWLLLGETISGKLIVDTTTLADGPYLLRAIGSDGATTTTSDSRRITIKNQLPLIQFDNGRRTVVSKGFATVRGSVFAPDIIGNRPLIVGLEYSRDRGFSWVALTAADGAYDAFEERFAVIVAFSEPFEGSHDVIWRATDSRGLTATARHTVIVDTTPPKAPSLVFPENNSFMGRESDENRKKEGLQMTLSGRAESRSIVEIEVGGRSYSTEVSLDGAWRQTVEMNNRGKYEIATVSVDAAGNKSAKATAMITYNTPPQVVFISPREGRGVHGNFDVRWLSKDPDGDTIKGTVLSYRRAGAVFTVLARNPKGNSFTWDTTKLKTGDSYELKLEASDGFATSSESVLIAIDNHLPTLDSLSLPQTAFAGEGLLVASGLASDDLSGVEFVEYAITKEGAISAERAWLKAKINNGFLTTKASFTLQERLSIADGTYRLQVRAVDASGNVSSAKEETIQIDSTPPRFGSLALLYRLAPIFPIMGHFTVPLNTPLSLALSLEDDTSEAGVEINGSTILLQKDNASGLWKTDFSLPHVGTTTISLSVTDLSGNKGKEDMVATIVVVSPGRITYRENGVVLPVAEKTIGVLVAPSSGNSFLNWKGETSLYGTPTNLPAGEYFLALPRGTYQLLVSGGGFQQLKTESFTLSEAQFITTDFTLLQKRSIWGIIKAWIGKKLSRQ